VYPAFALKGVDPGNTESGKLFVNTSYTTLDPADTHTVHVMHAIWYAAKPGCKALLPHLLC
jgi:hypothetical protein